MRRTASAICLARTVCCSNLVFTADWEMHSWNRQEVPREAGATSQEPGSGIQLPGTWLGSEGGTESLDNRIKGSCSPQISSQNSETQTSSLESLLQERPLGEVHHVSPEITQAAKSFSPRAPITNSFSQLFLPVDLAQDPMSQASGKSKKLVLSSPPSGMPWAFWILALSTSLADTKKMRSPAWPRSTTPSSSTRKLVQRSICCRRTWSPGRQVLYDQVGCEGALLREPKAPSGLFSKSTGNLVTQLRIQKVSTHMQRSCPTICPPATRLPRSQVTGFLGVQPVQDT